MKGFPTWLQYWFCVSLVGLLTIATFLFAAKTSQASPTVATSKQIHSIHDSSSSAGIGWVKQTVETDGNLGYDGSLALDTYDQPHLSYVFGKNPPDDDEIRYAWYDGTTWNIEIVDSHYTIGPPSIQLHPIGELSWPRITYAGGDKTPGLMFAYRKIGGWTIEVIEEYGNAWQNSLAIKDNDSACIAYQGTSN